MPPQEKKIILKESGEFSKTTPADIDALLGDLMPPEVKNTSFTPVRPKSTVNSEELLSDLMPDFSAEPTLQPEAPKEAEQNPFKSFGKSIWNTLNYQLPAAAAAALSTEGVFELFSRPGRWVDVSDQVKKDARKELLKWAIEREKQGQEYSADLIQTIEQIESPLDALNWASVAMAQGVAQIPAAVLTGGTTSMAQEIGSIYLESVKKIAEEKGITPEEVIDKGLDDGATSIAFGTAAGLLDRIGAGKVLNGFGRKAVEKELKSRAKSVLAKTAAGTLTESATEGAQAVIEDIGAAKAADKSWNEAFKSVDPSNVINSLAAGAVPGAGLSYVGAKFDKAKAKTEEQNRAAQEKRLGADAAALQQSLTQPTKDQAAEQKLARTQEENLTEEQRKERLRTRLSEESNLASLDIAGEPISGVIEQIPEDVNQAIPSSVELVDNELNRLNLVSLDLPSGEKVIPLSEDIRSQIDETKLTRETKSLVRSANAKSGEILLDINNIENKAGKYAKMSPERAKFRIAELETKLERIETALEKRLKEAGVISEEVVQEKPEAQAEVQQVPVEAIDNLVNKIIQGDQQYTPEELQLQNNFSAEVEQKLQEKIAEQPTEQPGVAQRINPLDIQDRFDGLVNKIKSLEKQRSLSRLRTPGLAQQTSKINKLRKDVVAAIQTGNPEERQTKLREIDNELNDLEQQVENADLDRARLETLPEEQPVDLLADLMPSDLEEARSVPKPTNVSDQDLARFSPSEKRMIVAKQRQMKENIEKIDLARKAGKLQRIAELSRRNESLAADIEERIQAAKEKEAGKPKKDVPREKVQEKKAEVTTKIEKKAPQTEKVVEKISSERPVDTKNLNYQKFVEAGKLVDKLALEGTPRAGIEKQLQDKGYEQFIIDQVVAKPERKPLLVENPSRKSLYEAAEDIADPEQKANVAKREAETVTSGRLKAPADRLGKMANLVARAKADYDRAAIEIMADSEFQRFIQSSLQTALDKGKKDAKGCVIINLGPLGSVSFAIRQNADKLSPEALQEVNRQVNEFIESGIGRELSPIVIGKDLTMTVFPYANYEGKPLPEGNLNKKLAETVKRKQILKDRNEAFYGKDKTVAGEKQHVAGLKDDVFEDFANDYLIRKSQGTYKPLRGGNIKSGTAAAILVGRSASDVTLDPAVAVQKKQILDEAKKNPDNYIPGSQSLAVRVGIKNEPAESVFLDIAPKDAKAVNDAVNRNTKLIQDALLSVTESIPASNTSKAKFVANALEAFKKKYKGAEKFLDFKIVASPSELPINVPAKTAGAVIGNTVYLIEPNIQNPVHAQRVLFEETISHRGLAAMMGEDFAPLLKEVADNLPERMNEAAIRYEEALRLQGIDPKSEQGQRILAQEVIAKIADEKLVGKELSTWQKIVAAIRNWVRKVWPNLKLSENDITTLTSRAADAVRRGDLRPATDQDALLRKNYDLAGSYVSDLEVTTNIPNQSSISATIDDYEILDGVRELPLSDFNSKPTDLFYAADDIKRTKELAEKIKRNGKIDPLIVVIDKEGPYILEGAHRLGALDILGKKTFPAQVVIDNESTLFAQTNQTDTPEFKRWFGKSKVVDKNNEPLVVYHGTNKNFTEFIPKPKKGNQISFGIHLTPDKTFADEYAKGKNARLVEAYISIKNPLNADQLVREGSKEFNLGLKLSPRTYVSKDENGIRAFYLRNAIEQTSGKRAESIIKGAGYDGLIYEAEIRKLVGVNTYIPIKKAKTYVVFSSNQIKSTSNQGTFDPNNPNILFSMPPDPLLSVNSFDNDKYAQIKEFAQKVQSQLGKPTRSEWESAMARLLGPAYNQIKPIEDQLWNEINGRKSPTPPVSNEQTTSRGPSDVQKFLGGYATRLVSVLENRRGSKGFIPESGKKAGQILRDAIRISADLRGENQIDILNAQRKIASKNPLAINAGAEELTQTIQIADGVYVTTGQRLVNQLDKFDNINDVREFANQNLKTESAREWLVTMFKILSRMQGHAEKVGLSNFKKRFTPVLTAESREALKKTKSNEFKALVRAVAAINEGVSLKQAESALYDISKRDVLLSGKLLELPAVIKVDGKDIAMIEFHPFQALEAINAGLAKQIAFRRAALSEFRNEEGKTGEAKIRNGMDKLESDYALNGGNVADFTNAFDTYFSRPLWERRLSIRNKAVRIAKNLGYSTATELLLFGSGPVQIGQPLIIAKALGAKNFAKAVGSTVVNMARSRTRTDLLNYLRTVEGMSTELLDMYVNEHTYWEDVGRIVRSIGGRIGWGRKWIITWNDILASQTGKVFADGIVGNANLSNDQLAGLRFLEFSAKEIEAMKQGRLVADSSHYREIIRRAKKFSQGTGIVGPEKSKVQNLPEVMSLAQFQHYPILMQQILTKHFQGIRDAVIGKNDAKLTNQLNRLAGLFAGGTAAGHIALYMRAIIKNRPTDRSDEDWLEWFFNNIAESMLFGPVYSTWESFERASTPEQFVFRFIPQSTFLFDAWKIARRQDEFRDYSLTEAIGKMLTDNTSLDESMGVITMSHLWATRKDPVLMEGFRRVSEFRRSKGLNNTGQTSGIRGYFESRAQLRKAMDLIQKGQDPSEAIVNAIVAKSKEQIEAIQRGEKFTQEDPAAKIKAQIQSRRVLDNINENFYSEMRDKIGAKYFDAVYNYDRILDNIANSVKPKRRRRR